MRYSAFEIMASILCVIGFAIGLMGCSARSSYTIKWAFVNASNPNKEVRTVDGEVFEKGFYNKTILINFPRTMKMIDEELIWKWRKK